MQSKAFLRIKRASVPVTGESVPPTGPLVPLSGGSVPLTGPLVPLSGGSVPLTGPLVPLSGGSVPLTGLFLLFITFNSQGFFRGGSKTVGPQLA